jgi:hypothetical protein
MVRSYSSALSHSLKPRSPGRFFAANQLKLLLASIVTKYDIEPISARPTNPWLNNTIGPPIWESLRVRRRPGTVTEAADVAIAGHEETPAPLQKDSVIQTTTESLRSTGLLEAKALQTLTGSLHELGKGPLVVDSA